MNFSDPRIIKLLKSTQAAFPIGRNPWDDLARGLSATREEIADWMDELNRAGAVTGAWAEPNVHHPSIGESLVSRDASNARWSASTSAGDITSQWSWEGEISDGWPAERWFKIGIALDLRAAAETADPFAPSQDRTSMPESPIEWPKLEVEAGMDLVALSEPTPLNPRQPVWETLVEKTDLTDPRAAVQRVVLSRLARRFALRLSPTALGWRGCGLACWSLESSDAERAAGALAAITCTGDVAIRKPTTDWPFNLSAVILGHAPDSGKEIAAGISRKWGRDLGRWVGFQSLR